MIDPHRFRGRVAIVTGAGSGIGRATAERIVREGGSVAFVDLVTDSIEHFVSRNSPRTLSVRADVSDEDSIVRVIDDVVHTFGRLDIVVNAAGVAGGVQPIHEASWDVFSKVMQLNVGGVFLMTKYASAAMIANSNTGVIVNISSISATQPGNGTAAYCASKAAVAMLTKTAALDLAQHGIRVVAIAPGVVETPMTSRAITSDPETLGTFTAAIPLGRLGIPDDVAAAISFVAGSDGSYMTGSTICVDGGMSLRAFPDRRITSPPPSLTR